MSYVRDRTDAARKRLRYTIRFIYWLIRHRSISSARWVCEYEGMKWN